MTSWRSRGWTGRATGRLRTGMPRAGKQIPPGAAAAAAPGVMSAETTYRSASVDRPVCVESNGYVEQPDPIKNDLPAVWDLVLKDMADRDYTGLRRYNTRLQPHNGRDALRDAYEEALDLAVYLRQAIY